MEMSESTTALYLMVQAVLCLRPEFRPGSGWSKRRAHLTSFPQVYDSKCPGHAPFHLHSQTSQWICYHALGGKMTLAQGIG